jgi:hypothetical protein
MSLVTDVAALYVDPRGPYPKLVEHWWDEKRDARTYAGNLPVVAHPPCGPWSALRHLHERQEEKALALLAIEQVRRWGGVLEHPASSKLFELFLPRPGQVDRWGKTIAVDQCDWGHPARKSTCLYLVRVTRMLHAPAKREPTHWCSGTHTPGQRGTVPPGIKVCSAQQRRRTPEAFARWLISLAQQASPTGGR